MPSLFNPQDNQQLIERLKSLKPEAQAEWGKMNVSQMLAHVQEPLKMALGDLVLKRSLVSVLFGKSIKNKLLREEQFARNYPTAKQFRMTDLRHFEKERENLIPIIQKFVTAGSAGITDKPHPFFGKMSPAEWDTIQWKHIDHHFRQFGV